MSLPAPRNKRSELLQVRLTREEKRLAARLARAQGLDMSGWIRNIIARSRGTDAAS